MDILTLLTIIIIALVLLSLGLLIVVVAKNNEIDRLKEKKNKQLLALYESFFISRACWQPVAKKIPAISKICLWMKSMEDTLRKMMEEE